MPLKHNRYVRPSSKRKAGSSSLLSGFLQRDKMYHVYQEAGWDEQCVAEFQTAEALLIWLNTSGCDLKDLIIYHGDKLKAEKIGSKLQLRLYD